MWSIFDNSWSEQCRMASEDKPVIFDYVAMWGIIMNIFVLDEDPVISAQQACDKHVVKMILESAQMIKCSIFPQGEAPYNTIH